MPTQVIEGTSIAYTTPVEDIVSVIPHSDDSLLMVLLDQEGCRVTLEIELSAADSLAESLLEALQDA